MTIEIVFFSRSYVKLPEESPENPMKPPFCHGFPMVFPWSLHPFHVAPRYASGGAGALRLAADPGREVGTQHGEAQGGVTGTANEGNL